ncbi:hypothetical protein P152DRAFT_161593 [Eremomyces bilateralis CBS 781.70]|uniref:Transcriptional regulator n=1 Tax=Eremomyces bilateralis CBS 781.70 TaxID=1392243 RepID=A0A6G1FUI0_9PEZI|nr:uncharacterized protein P152DRAFT_161593 [Eremomyces bilateralis CBS 781.70]KAF1809358.1 hypothetical protein P152DRAFT_161593 [Eremomyces bilateralis CBS 781.70]
MDQVEPDPKSSKKKRKSSEHDDHPRKKRKEPVGKDEEETKESPPKELASTSHSSPEPAPALESDSDMSVLIDDGPPRKKTKAAKSGAKAKAKATKPKAPKAAQSKSDGSTSQESEIKRLQGWLIKCGIRKLWHRELAPYATPGEKIGHLKEMLRDAGMEGRYSAEKARQIKEQRELAADLEAVTEGNKVWGKKKEAEQDETKETKEKRGRTLAKGFKDLAFLEDDDEESD